VSAITIVWAKECIDNLRDRRTLTSSLSLALLGPLFFVGIMSLVLHEAIDDQDDAIRFSVVGAAHAPELIRYLESQNSEIERIDLAQGLDPRKLVQSGEHDLIIVIPANHGERLRAGRLSTLTVVYDSAKLGSSPQRARRVERMLETWGRTLSVLRLQLRGIDPILVQPVMVDSVDVASNAEHALKLLGMVPYFVLLGAFMGGFYLAIDTTAGEREQGSLEPLLSQPVSRSALVLGKIAAISTFTAASLLLMLAGFYFGLPFVPLNRIGLQLDFTLVNFACIFVLLLPLMWFAAALLTVAASFAKTYKEAQTYLSFLILVPTLPIVFTQLFGVEATTWMMMIPSLGQALLMTAFMTNDHIAWMDVLISMSSTSLLAVLLTAFAVNLYSRERVLG
jgi:sodium transport system permease protein